MPRTTVIRWDEARAARGLDLLQAISTNRCGNPRARVLNPDGTYWEVRCNVMSCPGCLAYKALRLARAVALAAPTKEFTLTNFGDSFVEIKAQLDRLLRRCKYRGYEFEWFYQVEPNRSGKGAHVHVWLHGRVPSLEVLSRIVTELDLGPVFNYESVREPQAAAMYGLKIPRAAADSDEAMELARTYLSLNGGRLFHASRGYFRDAEGRRITRREAEVLSAEYQRGKQQ